MDKITIDNTDIIFDDIELGSGKLTISNTYGYNFSTYWGSMGTSGGGQTLKEFILDIDCGYFTRRLSKDTGVFSAKLSVSNVRRFIKEEMKYDLPWYEFMSAQKELREKLMEIEDCPTDRDFIDAMSSLSDSIMCYDLDRHDEKKFKDIINSLESEPWHFIETGDSEDTLFLVDLFPKLQKAIKKLG